MSDTLSCAVPRQALLDALTSAARIADKKVIPIFASVLLQADGNALRWWASDGTLWRSGLVPAVQASGSGLVPAVQALAVVKACGAPQLQLTGSRTCVSVTSGGYVAKLPVLPLEDYPTRPLTALALPVTCSVAAGTLRTMLTHVAPSINISAIDIAGALFRRTNGDLVCVAVDKYQLARIERPALGEPFEDAIVSAQAVAEVLRMLKSATDTIEMSITEDRHVFHVGADVLIALPVAKRFPAFERILPKKPATTFTCGRVHLLDTLDRVMLAADDPQYAVDFFFEDGRLQLSAKSPRLGEASDWLDATTSDGPKASFRLNPRYVRACLDRWTSETVACDIVNELQPVLFRADASEKSEAHDDIHIIMPMRP